MSKETLLGQERRLMAYEYISQRKLMTDLLGGDPYAGLTRFGSASISSAGIRTMSS
jgi:hypothetical protein